MKLIRSILGKLTGLRDLPLWKIFAICIASIALFFGVHYGFRSAKHHWLNNPFLVQKRCDSGDGHYCFVMGVQYRDGRVVAVDKQKSSLSFKRACDLNISHGCYYYAQDIKSLSPAERNPGQELSLYEKSCNLGLAYGCAEAGVLLLRDKSSKDSLIDSEKYLLQACSLGGVQCSKHAEIALSRDLTETERTAILKAYRKACAEGDQYMCLVASIVSLPSLDPEARNSEIQTALKNGCESGIRMACAGRALRIMANKHSKESVQEAITVLETSCGNPRTPGMDCDLHFAVTHNTAGDSDPRRLAEDAYASWCHKYDGSCFVMKTVLGLN